MEAHVRKGQEECQKDLTGGTEMLNRRFRSGLPQEVPWQQVLTELILALATMKGDEEADRQVALMAEVLSILLLLPGYVDVGLR